MEKCSVKNQNKFLIFNKLQKDSSSCKALKLAPAIVSTVKLNSWMLASLLCQTEIGPMSTETALFCIVSPNTMSCYVVCCDYCGNTSSFTGGRVIHWWACSFTGGCVIHWWVCSFTGGRVHSLVGVFIHWWVCHSLVGVFIHWWVCHSLVGVSSPQEKEAKEQMKRKAKEIQMAKKEMQRSGGGGRYGGISECAIVRV